MQDLFPNHTEHYYMTDPAELPEAGADCTIFHIETEVCRILTSQLQLKKRNYPIFDFWWDVYNWYISGI